MEKCLYLLWQPPDCSPPEWADRLLAIAPDLLARGAARVRIAIPDVPIPDPDPLAAMRRDAPQALVSFWLNTALVRGAAEAVVRACAGKIAGYSVVESVVLPETAAAAGEREEGFLQVAAFRALPTLSRPAFFDAWLGVHTAVAVETQSTRSYTQNIVVRPLTQGAPALDGIVEERFPAAALNDQHAYFDAADAGCLAARQQRMAASCIRFIDMADIKVANCGLYRFGGWCDAPSNWRTDFAPRGHSPP